MEDVPWSLERKEACAERVAEKRSLVGALVGAKQTQSPQPLHRITPLFPGAATCSRQGKGWEE